MTTDVWPEALILERETNQEESLSRAVQRFRSLDRCIKEFPGISIHLDSVPTRNYRQESDETPLKRAEGTIASAVECEKTPDSSHVMTTPTEARIRRTRKPVWKQEYETMVCHVCKSPHDDENMLICDKCDRGFHLYCLCPQMVAIPEHDWYCHFCQDKDEVKGKLILILYCGGFASGISI